MGPDDIAPNQNPAEAPKPDLQPWDAPKLRILAASAAEFGGAGSIDAEGLS
ncbi:hypothetical protein SH591_03540 [Sphingomonas sp. LY54]|uniref:hypothetical protein n=1 Tax=Sphingomonas sp. LY54 TaxID=3095343 RepID=UPI002D77E26C|nr:hypothetical protein [Sphingomonas sp. LY54]WRP29270.1 hypothetical protein SH591_03540 [Sphingomonas sp. LY54]